MPRAGVRPRRTPISLAGGRLFSHAGSCGVGVTSSPQAARTPRAMHQERTGGLYTRRSGRHTPKHVPPDGACYHQRFRALGDPDHRWLGVHRGGSGCLRPKQPGDPSPPQRNAAGILVTGRPIFAVLPAESERYPRAAQSATQRMREARLVGFDPPQLSNISLEMLQLSIECIDPTVVCYEAVGKTLQANQILFTEIGPGKKRKQVKVKVTLFDVDSRSLRGNETKVFPSEAAAEEGMGDVIAKVTAR